MKTIETPLDRYNAWLAADKLETNHEQQAVIAYLTQVQRYLIQRQHKRNTRLGRLRRRIKPRAPIHGLYLWGSVGVGKTMMMDFFYDTLPVTKLRLHFHGFMQRVHRELRSLQGHANPLTLIGKRLADQYVVICFDEFYVTNVADAMLLAELFKALFRGGVCLVTTSNLPPGKLYERGLQRQRFLPAVDLITQHTRVWHLTLQQDYRHRALKQLDAYYTPLDDQAGQAMWHAMQRFVGANPLSQNPLTVCGRQIAVKQQAEQIVWFEFTAICGRPRSQQDYLALAKKYKVVLLSNIPCLEHAAKDLVVSFINLVDVFYDEKIELIVSAAVPIEQLYTQGEFQQLFQRTESRLIEMQSEEYYSAVLEKIKSVSN